MLRFLGDVAVIRLDPQTNAQELEKVVSGLYRSTATGTLKGVVLDLQGKDRLDPEIRKVLNYLDRLRYRSRRYHSGKSRKVYDRPLNDPAFVVLCNPSPSGFLRQERSPLMLPNPVLDSVEKAIEWFMVRHDDFPGRSEGLPELPRGGQRRLFLVGCPDRDLYEIPAILRETGFEVADSATDTLTDGDHVIFCVSCLMGPSEGTTRSVLDCSGRSIVPVCILINSSMMVVDESLVDLVIVDEQWLLAKILPEALVDILPIFYDFDLNLPAKIVERLENSLKPIRCM